MTRGVSNLFSLTAEALNPGTTVRYYYGSGDALATVVRRSADYVSFLGRECNGTFTYDQIERLFAEGRLEIVLDDETHVPDEDVAERLLGGRSDSMQ